MKKKTVGFVVLSILLLLFLYRISAGEAIDPKLPETSDISAVSGESADLQSMETFPLHSFPDETGISEIPDEIRNSEIPVGEIQIEAFNNYYFTFLTAEEQGAYAWIYNEAIQFRTYINVESFQFEVTDIEKIVWALFSDSPELFWLDGGFSFQSDEQSGVVRIISLTGDSGNTLATKAMGDEIQTITSGMIQEANRLPTDYEKVKYFYEEIIQNTEYVFDSVNNQNIRSVFFGKKSVCAGYAKALQYLLEQAEIPCILVVGETVDGASHAWNMVRLGEQYYWVDVTWGDPVFLDHMTEDYPFEDEILSYDYLCITDEEIFRTHSLLSMHSETLPRFYELPACVSTDYDYYRLFEIYMDDFDPGAIKKGIIERFQSEKKEYIVKFRTRADMQKMLDEMRNGDILFDIYDSVEVEMKIYADYNEEIYRVKVYFSEV